MQDKALKKMIAEVLGMEEFDAGAMCGRLSHISAYGDMLTFHFHDGHTEKGNTSPEKEATAGRRENHAGKKGNDHTGSARPFYRTAHPPDAETAGSGVCPRVNRP